MPELSLCCSSRQADLQLRQLRTTGTDPRLCLSGEMQWIPLVPAIHHMPNSVLAVNGLREVAASDGKMDIAAQGAHHASDRQLPLEATTIIARIRGRSKGHHRSTVGTRRGDV